MGTANAILLLAVPNTNWVNATFSWVTTGRSISRVTVKRSVSWVTVKRSTQPDPAPGRFVPSFLRGATSFFLPGESYLLPFLKRLGAAR